MKTQSHQGSFGPRHELLRAYVVKNGLKFTRQRELIAEVFFKSDGHLSVENLLEEVRQTDPQVSLATVYRTMKLLTECGLAAAHRFGDGHTRYEPHQDGDEKHHDHLICTRCGKIVEFFNSKIEDLQHAVAKENGFAVSHHRMELYGLCRECNASDRARSS